MRNARLDEAQAGIKILGKILITSVMQMIPPLWQKVKRNFSSFSLLMKVKEECGRAGLKLNTQKTKIIVFDPITLWQIDGETMETITDFIFLGSKITADGDCIHEIKRCLLLVTNLDSTLKAETLLCQQRSI